MAAPVGLVDKDSLDLMVKRAIIAALSKFQIGATKIRKTPVPRSAFSQILKQLLLSCG